MVEAHERDRPGGLLDLHRHAGVASRAAAPGRLAPSPPNRPRPATRPRPRWRYRRASAIPRGRNASPWGRRCSSGFPRSRGTYSAKRSYVARSPALNSAGRNRYGPLPTISGHLAERIGIGEPFRHDAAARRSRTRPARRADAGTVWSGGSAACDRPAPTTRWSPPSAPGRSRRGRRSAGCSPPRRVRARACRRETAARRAAAASRACHHSRRCGLRASAAGRHRFVQAIQRVEHQIGVDVRSPRGTPDRIEQGQGNARNVFERSFALRPRDMRRGEHHGTGGQFEDITALHGALPGDRSTGVRTIMPDGKSSQPPSAGGFRPADAPIVPALRREVLWPPFSQP